MFLAHYVFIRVIDLSVSKIRVTYMLVLKHEAAAAAQAVGHRQLMGLTGGKFK